jgi:translation initiation factor IF-2
MQEEKVGVVKQYFAKPEVAAIELTDGSLTIGDKIHIKGHTTDFEESISSMQIEHNSVQEVKAGDLVGIKVSQRVRPNDQVYKVVD